MSEPVDRVRRAFAAFDAHDLEALASLLAPDVEWLHWDAGPWDCHGREAVVARMRQRIDEGFSGELTTVAAGPSGAVFARIDGNHRHVCMVLTFRDGEISRMRDYGSEQEARIAAGLAEHTPPPPPGPGHDHVHALVPFVHVADVAASAAFYAHFGFEVRDTVGPDARLDWCWLETADGAQLMLARADEPVDRHAQAVLFFLYTRDLAGLRERLVAADLRPSPIHDGTPGPRYEMRIADPDGYVVMVTQLEEPD
jgi:ketosteroid isomerase-like protein